MSVTTRFNINYNYRNSTKQVLAVVVILNIMKSNKLRKEFKNIFKIDVIFIPRNSKEPVYALDYVHWLEDKLLAGWQKVEDKLPDDEISVLCYHIDSGNYFICYRTIDCLTHEPKWKGGAMPTHWKFLDKPLSNDR